MKAISALCQSKSDDKTEFDIFSSTYNYVISHYSNESKSSQIQQAIQSMQLMIEEFSIDHEMDQENWQQMDDFIFENIVLKNLK